MPVTTALSVGSRVALFAAWLALGGCAGFPYRAPPCTGEVVAVGDVPPGQTHLRVELTHDGRVQRHELVVVARAESVDVVGLTPLGTVAYRLSQDAGGTEVENRVGRMIGLDARLAWDAVAHGVLATGTSVPGVRVARDGDAVRVENDVCDYRAVVVTIGAPDAPPPP
ncbi:MAG: DUF3261 domain-containing protein [Myxococcota bacterium]